MSYFVAYYGLWMSAALIAGMLAAFASQPRPPRPEAGVSRPQDFVIALCVLLSVALARVSYGRVALYLESAVCLAIAFLAGAAVVIACFGRISRDRKGWKIGVASVPLLWIFANADAARRLELDLEHDIGSLIRRAGGEPPQVEVSGRDVFLPIETAAEARLVEGLDRLPGVRSVWRVDGLSPRAAGRWAAAIAAEAEWKARMKSAQSASQEAAARRAVSGPDVAKVSEGRSTDPRAAPRADAEEPIAWKAPIDPTLPVRREAENRAEAATLARAPAQVDQDAACRAMLSDAVAAQKIRFDVARASVRDAEPLLEKIADLLKRCPDVSLEIDGHADAQGSAAENRALSLRRAQSVADRLARFGVERSRLTTVGYGAEQPLAPGDTPAARAENRRVEFAVR
jgi:outer membrane protein OmpA-like peptidoglycan-associated protein